MTDPIDDTQPHATPASGAGTDGAPGAATDPAPDAATDRAPGTGEAGAPAASPGPSLRADPDRPADSGWREPPWFPPRDRARERDRRPSPVAIGVGLILIAVGAYYFLDRTLGIELPRIQWSSVWPIFLIVLGGLILIRSFHRKS